MKLLKLLNSKILFCPYYDASHNSFSPQEDMPDNVALLMNTYSTYHTQYVKYIFKHYYMSQIKVDISNNAF